GYVFAGWSPEVPGTMPTENTTCVAQWSPATDTAYKVEHYLEDAEGTYTIDSSLTENKEGTTEATVTATAKTISHYTENTTHTDRVASGTVAADGSLVLKLYYARDSYTISFNSDGGSAVSAITQKHGTTVTAPADPTKTGYVFAGWSPEVPETMPTENTICVAQWNANSYTVTFNANGGETAIPESQTVTYGEAYGPLATTSREGYKFDGWYTAVEGGSKITAASVVTAVTNHTLYAYWMVNQYTITFDTVGGTEVAPITQDYGTTVTAPENPTKPGYTFEGWDKTIPSTMPAANMTITAIWEKDNSKWHTVTFEAGANGTFEGTPETEYSDILEGTTFSEAKIVIPMPKANSGYEFDKWTPNEPNSSTVVNSDLTFIANFKATWEAPDVRIDNFESVNVTNDDGNKAEPGTEIEYEIVIKNYDDVAALIDIRPESGMTIVSPENYEDITLEPGESITVVVKKTVPENYEVAGKDFKAKITVAIKNNEGKEETITDSTTNEIEKTTMVKIGEPVDKNIVLTIDISGSMLFCTKHNSVTPSSKTVGDWYNSHEVYNADEMYRYPSDYTFEGGYNAYNEYYLYNNESGYQYSTMPFVGHQTKVDGVWIKCSDTESRIDIVKKSVKDFVDTIYASSIANDERVTITVVTFNGAYSWFGTHYSTANAGTTYLLNAENVALLKNEIENIVAENGTGIKQGLEKAADVFGRSNMLENAENYAIFFGDGEPSSDGVPGSSDYTNLKNAVDYSYAIGFGPDFADTSSDAYDILNNIVKGDGITVTQAEVAADVTAAFANIANRIATSQQSKDGKIIVTLPTDGKYYPITATYINEGTLETLFTITNASGLAENDITISEDGEALIWDISGTEYSRYNGLSLKLGKEEAQEELTMQAFRLFSEEVVEEPETEEAVIEEPETEEAVLEEPETEEPVIEEPETEEAETEEPVIEEPETEEAETEEPVIEELETEEPVIEEPETEEPVIEEPETEEAETEEPETEEAETEEPETEEPEAEEPEAEEPETEEPVIEEPEAEEAETEETETEEPEAEEPVIEEPEEVK
ncbi:MAG: InlB B-repeat-containing protein, partial [Clostridia bacterium]|nr:InlB B-repeat-containing protein [Clostridia bacterium]